MAHVHDDSDSTHCDSNYNSTPNVSDSDSDSTPNDSDSTKLTPELESESSFYSDSGVGIVPGLVLSDFKVM